MRYFELLDDVTVPGRWHLSSIHTADGSEPQLRAGIDCNDESLRTEVSHPGVELDFCLTSFAVPVARCTLAAAMETVADGDVQRLPIFIPNHERFEIVNVLRVIKCLDESRSEFTKWTVNDHRSDLAGQYRQVTKLKVSGEAIASNAHVFRIEGWLVGLVVSETMKQAMEKTECLGARFAEVT